MPSIVGTPLAVSQNPSVSSVSIGGATGKAPGDRVEFRILISGQTIATPGGWSLVSNTVIASTRRLYIFNHTVVTSGEAATAFPFSATAQCGYAVVTLRNCDPVNPYNVVPSISQNAANQNGGVANSISPDRTGTLLIHSFHAVTVSASATLSTPAGMTLLASDVGDGTNGLAVALFSELRATSGPTGTRTSSGGVAAPWGASASAFNPYPHQGSMLPAFFGMNHHGDELAARREEREWKQRESGIYCRDSGLVAA